MLPGLEDQIESEGKKVVCRLWRLSIHTNIFHENYVSEVKKIQESQKGKEAQAQPFKVTLHIYKS